MALLELPGHAEPQRALQEMLALAVELTGAERAYLELYSSELSPRLVLSHACDEAATEAIARVTSRGIVAAAIASGQTVHTPSAAVDPDYRNRPSVRSQGLEAILCVPIVGTTPGVLYLEAPRGLFSAEAVQLVEQMARFVSPGLERAAELVRQRAPDPTRPFRQKLRLEGLAGHSTALARVFEQVALVAPLDVSVLLTGPSGTGKTALARAIHASGARAHGPFVELNCAAIPEGLFESELFGTMPSAFPGARRTKGKVEAAEGGTLFLDEIGEIPFTAQGKLLQVLQSKQYYALASSKPATANVRIIAATNANLEERIAARTFREDLYFRLNVITIPMPGLDERRSDIPLLVDELIGRLAAEHRLKALPPSHGFRAVCESLEWPGNVRQLRHRLEAALIRANAEGAAQLEPRHLDPGRADKNTPLTFHESTQLYQKELLRRELAQLDWNINLVAQRLDISRSHLYNLINAFGLQRPE